MCIVLLEKGVSSCRRPVSRDASTGRKGLHELLLGLLASICGLFLMTCGGEEPRPNRELTFAEWQNVHARLLEKLACEEIIPSWSHQGSVVWVIHSELDVTDPNIRQNTLAEVHELLTNETSRFGKPYRISFSNRVPGTTGEHGLRETVGFDMGLAPD